MAIPVRMRMTTPPTTAATITTSDTELDSGSVEKQEEQDGPQKTQHSRSLSRGTSWR